MCLVLPISNNYTQGWKQTEMTLETVKYRTNQKGCTLAEIIHKDHIMQDRADARASALSYGPTRPGRPILLPAAWKGAKKPVVGADAGRQGRRW